MDSVPETSRMRRPRPVRPGGRHRSGHDARIAGEPEVVVAREIEQAFIVGVHQSPGEPSVGAIGRLLGEPPGKAGLVHRMTRLWHLTTGGTGLPAAKTR